MNTNHIDASITVSLEIRHLLTNYVVTKENKTIGKLVKVVSSFSESFESFLSRENIIQHSKFSTAIDGHHFRSTFDGIFSSLKSLKRPFKCL